MDPIRIAWRQRANGQTDCTAADRALKTSCNQDILH
jgi:hypothetical protein